MLHFLPAGEVKKRAGEIRLSLSALSEAAGLHFTNVCRAARDNREMRTDTAQKLTEALIAEERKLFDHLVALHPDWLAPAEAERAAA